MESDVFDLSGVHLPPPLIAALLPWWITIGPAAVAVITGRFLLAAVLTGGGLVLSVGAAVGILIAEARAGE